MSVSGEEHSTTVDPNSLVFRRALARAVAQASVDEKFRAAFVADLRTQGADIPADARLNIGQWPWTSLPPGAAGSIPTAQAAGVASVPAGGGSQSVAGTTLGTAGTAGTVCGTVFTGGTAGTAGAAPGQRASRLGRPDAVGLPPPHAVGLPPPRSRMNTTTDGALGGRERDRAPAGATHR